MKTIEIEMTIADIERIWSLCEKEAQKAKPGSSREKTYNKLCSLFFSKTEEAEEPAAEEEKIKEFSPELLECLFMAEYIFEEKKEFAYRFCLQPGEEYSMSSLRKNLKVLGMQDFEKELKAMKRRKECKICLDDGALHLTFSKEMFSEEQRIKIEKDYTYDKLY